MPIQFTPHPEAAYRFDYDKFFHDLAAGCFTEAESRSWYREFILNDLFFIVCFVMQIEKANHPFVVQQCQVVEDGPRTNTLDVWARFHFKSCIITQAETLQYHLANPEHCTGIHSYARTAAKPFLRSIKILCETSDLLKWTFPDILWEKPEVQAPKWSEDDGLIFKRNSASRKESTIEAWGLIEGQPTGRHFERNIFDDIETDDIKDNPEQLAKCFSKFEMAGNLGTGMDTDITRVIGTYYSHFGPVARIGEMEYESGAKIYHLRKVPGSHDGTRTGRPVLMGPETWEKLKMSQHFDTQQLCDPTPKGNIKLNPTDLKPIEPQFIPKGVYKFLLVDQAGDDEVNKTNGDPWAIGLFGVEPKLDDIGQSNVYILDGEADQMTHSEAIETVVRMYLNGGIIRQLGVEKVALSTTEKHIVDALKMKGRRVSEDSGNLVLLRPASRSLAKRIEGAVQWPLCNGKIFYSTSCPKKTVDLLKLEMEKFPFFHSNFLNILAYLYDVLKDFNFGTGEQRKSFSSQGVYMR